MNKAHCTLIVNYYVCLMSHLGFINKFIICKDKDVLLISGCFAGYRACLCEGDAELN